MLAICAEGGNDVSLSTKDKIIDATIELVNEKGYKGATTREIAKEAGVNEVTLFRHFGNKKGIIEAVIKKYEVSELLKTTFTDKVIWDLEKDLTMLAREHHSVLEQKKTIILLSFKEAAKFPELNELIKHIPQMYIDQLQIYFEEMVAKEKIKTTDPATVASNFFLMNFGYFLMKTRLNPAGEELSLDDFIENNIKNFIQSLQ